MVFVSVSLFSDIIEPDFKLLIEFNPYGDGVKSAYTKISKKF